MATKPSKKKLPPEERFPNRLEKVRRTAIEIARSIGRFEKRVGHARPVSASFREFRISFYTPFSPPTHWLRDRWADRNVRLSLHGLLIHNGPNLFLKMLWSGDCQIVDEFLDPDEDDWDRRLRNQWADFCHANCRRP